MGIRYARLELEIQRRLQLLEAVARERILSLRTTQALELIEMARDRVEPARALQIYGRLHGLDPLEIRTLADRVLSSLATAPPGSLDLDALDPDGDASGPLRLLHQVRRRLRGRVNRRLRHRIELHLGRSQVRLLSLHVDQALRFVEVLEPLAPVQDAVGLYAERLGVDEHVAGVLYFFVLDRLSAEARTAEAEAGRDVPAQDPAAQRTHPLRVVTGS